MDYRHDSITQNVFREIKGPKHPFITYYLLLRFLTVTWFCALRIHISSQLAKLQAVAGILFPTAFQEVLKLSVND